ncbi:hypothetical protein M0638_12280 [Roseomonas sp. NAR14]|uniref:Porphobilinogen deaminase n=1 Tax=Roseomonas acroporae TaxID=2937791 RepID=A0A9X1YFA8_9PROT|nr:hypothetical protein [Roseomonas acroporae]MCK8785161.1 hypothetical protein [Roseomonas acroporae]
MSATLARTAAPARSAVPAPVVPLRIGVAGPEAASPLLAAFGAGLPCRVIVHAPTGAPADAAGALHDALRAERIDCAVLGIDGLPLPAGLALAAVPRRAETRAALVLAPSCRPERRARPLPSLPAGARVAVRSARQRAQLASWRPDLRFGLVGGGDAERLARLRGGDFAAALVGPAGLRHPDLAGPPLLDPSVLDPSVLDLPVLDLPVLDLPELLPEAGAGLSLIAVRAGDAATRALLRRLDDAGAHAAALAEAALRERLGPALAGCLGARAGLLPDGGLRLEAVLALPSGGCLRRAVQGDVAEAARLGAALAARLLDGGARD